MARPTKLTTEAHRKIVGLVRAGNYRETACAAAGVTPKTLRNWLARAAKGGKSNEAYVQFALELDEAEATAELIDNNKITIAADAGDWRAAAWRLSRRSPERWGERKRLEHTGADGGPIETRQSGVVVLPAEDPAPDGAEPEAI
jgi:transposase